MRDLGLFYFINNCIFDLCNYFTQMVLLINIKKLFIKTKKKMLFKKGDYKAAVNKFILAMSNQDFELAKTLNTEIQAISNSAFIVDDMDCVERITFIKTGKLPARV